MLVIMDDRCQLRRQPLLSVCVPSIGSEAWQAKCYRFCTSILTLEFASSAGIHPDSHSSGVTQFHHSSGESSSLVGGFLQRYTRFLTIPCRISRFATDMLAGLRELDFGISNDSEVVTYTFTCTRAPLSLALAVCVAGDMEQDAFRQASNSQRCFLFLFSTSSAL